jgi:hypothetical protein
LGGPSRSFHGEGNRQHPGPERVLDLPGVAGGGTLGQSMAEQERPYLAAESGKDRAYKAGRLKSRRAGRESRVFELTRSRGGRYASRRPRLSFTAIVCGSQGGPCDPSSKDDAG